MTRNEILLLEDIYDFAYNTFFGTKDSEVQFRIAYGSKGAEQKVLQYIEDLINQNHKPIDKDELYTEWY